MAVDVFASFILLLLCPLSQRSVPSSNCLSAQNLIGLCKCFNYVCSVCVFRMAIDVSNSWPIATKFSVTSRLARTLLIKGLSDPLVPIELRQYRLFETYTWEYGYAPWFSSETLALYKSLTYLLTYLLMPNASQSSEAEIAGFNVR